MRDEFITLFGRETQARRNARGPREFGPVASCLVFMPLLAIAAPLSIPYMLVRRAVWNRHEKFLGSRMAKVNRVIGWADFIKVVNENRGTLIAECESSKGPFRRWWTPDNIYALTPYPCGDHVSMWFGEFLPFRKWCFEKYTSQTTGSAVLVIGTRDQWRSLKERLQAFRCVETVPPRERRRTRGAVSESPE